MGRTLFTIIIVALFFKGTTYAQQLSPQPVIPGQWIKSWMLCGPIPLQESKASLPVLYLKCKRTPLLAKYDDTYEKFSTIAKRDGVTFYAEAGEPHRISFHKSVESAK